MKLTPARIVQFRRKIWTFFRKNKRDFAWRRTTDPYAIYISEVMLQQTQVGRVEQKFEEWLKIFPDFKTLATVPQSAVVKAWQGMGYNRRATMLAASAQKIMHEYGGMLPRDPAILKTFPGLGAMTSCSIPTFAWNIPTVFIETNIRRVFLHEFFPRSLSVQDAKIIKLIAASLPRTRAREWYWALMDYGSYLSKAFPNANRRSSTYSVHPAFRGSLREVRGAILRVAAKRGTVGVGDLEKIFGKDARIELAFSNLLREGFLKKDKKNSNILA